MINIAAVKERVDLYSLITETVDLRGGPREYEAPCPRCGGKNRFHFNKDKGWFCRQCTGEPGAEGHWHDALDFIMWRDGVNFITAYERLGGGGHITPEESARLLAERTARQEEERRREQEAQAARRAELDESGAALRYWENLSQYPEAREMWEKRGLSRMWQDYFRVGYSPSREFWHDNKVFTSPSLTIPTWRGFHLTHSTALDEPNKDDPGGTNNACRCIGLAHRLLLPDAPGGKYRPHLSGVGKPLFNCDIYAPEILGDVLLIEGEVKSMVTWARIQDTFPAPSALRGMTVVGIAGKSFKREWVEEFSGAARIWICLDPDARNTAPKIAGLLGAARCRVIYLPNKIDDMLIAGTLQVSDIPALMKTARGVL
jgi:hypothetical protein